MRSVLVSSLLAVSLTAVQPLSAQLLPSRVEFAESELRKLLPPDGQLMERGKISYDYVGVAFGREVRAQGTKVFVSAKKLGDGGILFRDGYIELNIAAHVEKEVEFAGLRPTGAVDVAARIKLWLDDKLQVRHDLSWLYVEGDNFGGGLAVRFAQSQLRAAAEKEAGNFAAKLSKELQAKLPAGLENIKVKIQPGKLVVLRGPQADEVDRLRGGIARFKTTHDDREGGEIIVEIWRLEGGSPKQRIFAQTLREEAWGPWSQNQAPLFGGQEIPGGEYVAFVRLREAREVNISWTFHVRLELTSERGKILRFQADNVLLDTTGRGTPRTASVMLHMHHGELSAFPSPPPPRIRDRPSK